MNKLSLPYSYIVLVLVFSMACSIQSLASGPTPQTSSTAISTAVDPDETAENLIPTPSQDTTAIIPITSHLMQPAENAPGPEKMIDDTDSSGTGPEKRAPYGDSYKLNRFERPFLKDMTYVSDMDIHKFGLSQDTDWYYISIELIGNDPNNALGINYGIEIDLDVDGFGDYIIWAGAPYGLEWDTSTVQIFKDTNRDTAGFSGLQSDAISHGNGYEELVFNGGGNQNADPDLAWVRMIQQQNTILQFAFKKSLIGSFFMMGVVSDAGLKDVTKYDYADFFREVDAGSPIRGKENYPLGLLYAVDNTCWEAYGLQTSGYEPKLCQPILQPIPTSSNDDGGLDAIITPAGNEPPLACSPPPDCNGEDPGTGDFDPTTCECL